MPPSAPYRYEGQAWRAGLARVDLGRSLSSLFYKRGPAEHRERVDAFFHDLATPVDQQDVRGVQHAVYKLLGRKRLTAETRRSDEGVIARAEPELSG